jgi:hypothetical protein
LNDFFSQSSGPKIKMSLILDFFFKFAGNLFGLFKINGQNLAIALFFVFEKKKIELTSFLAKNFT